MTVTFWVVALCAASQTVEPWLPTFPSTRPSRRELDCARSGAMHEKMRRGVVMAAAFIEDPRVTRYRQRLAALLRRSSCRWISFAVGTAPIHRGFFADTAEAIEGLPTGDVQHGNGVSHRQVQYGVRLKIVDGADAFYDADGDVLVVPEESALDGLDGQAKLIGACVHLGLDIEGRNRQPLARE